MSMEQDLHDAIETLIDIKRNVIDINKKLEIIHETLKVMPWGQLNGALIEILEELRKISAAQTPSK